MATILEVVRIPNADGGQTPVVVRKKTMRELLLVVFSSRTTSIQPCEMVLTEQHSVGGALLPLRVSGHRLVCMRGHDRLEVYLNGGTHRLRSSPKTANASPTF